MEYTRSKGEHSYETFEGTPEEIAKLIKEIDKEPVEPNGKAPMKTATALAPVFPTPSSQGGDFDKVVEGIRAQVAESSKIHLGAGLGTKSF